MQMIDSFNTLKFQQISDYDKEIEIMNTMTKEEYLATLRR